MPSKVFGPTDSVADTLTQVGSTYQMLPSRGAAGWLIYAIRVAFGNVVNAKTNSGHILIETTERNYFYAFGNGQGAATNGHNSGAEKIDTVVKIGNQEFGGIFCPANQNVKVYVLQADVSKDVTVNLQFKPGGPNNYRTLAAGGVSGSGDTAADTEESFSSSSKLLRASLQPDTDGHIFRIRYAGTGIVDAKANSALIKVLVPGIGDPFEFAVGGGPGGAATAGGIEPADEILIPEGIPVKASSIVDVKITSAEIVKSPVISLDYI